MNDQSPPSQVFFPPLKQEDTLFRNNNNNQHHDSIIIDNSISPSSSPSTSSFLWSHIDTLSMPAESSSTPSPSWNTTPKGPPIDSVSISLTPNTPLEQQQQRSSAPPEDTSVFNISWGGGQDRPPLELSQEDPLPITPSKPLPKPRGIRRLPEPEPSEDGTVDEDTLKRRKNTTAARKSRMKKLMHIEHLEHQIQQLQTENSQLVLNNALFESEKKSLLAKEQEYKKRIKYLEDIVRMSCGHVLDESTPL